jgi:hypothetical protein
MKKIFPLILLVFTVGLLNQSCKRKKGCTDPTACNYDVEATKDDGSCELQQTWYKDEDGDGKGNLLVSTTSCTQPSGYVLDSSDSDDIKVEQKQRAIVAYRGSTSCEPCGAYGDPAKKYMEATYGKDVVILNGQTGAPIAYSFQFGTMFVKEMLEFIGLDGLPYAFWTGNGTFNHRPFWANPATNNGFADTDITNILSSTPTVGVGAFATITGTTVTVTTKTAFYNDVNTEKYIGVYLLEDGAMAEQLMSDAPSQVTEHNNVLRAAADGSTGPYGLISLGNSFTANNINTNTYNIQIVPPPAGYTPALNPWNTSKLQVAVVIWDGTNANQMSNAVLVDVYQK